MTNNDNEVGPGTVALLGIVCTVGGAWLIWQIKEGNSFAWVIFIALLIWVGGTYTRLWSPTFAVILLPVGYALGWLGGALISWVFGIPR
jgi:hypothetical protein